jgi:hypothetical protein
LAWKMATYEGVAAADMAWTPRRQFALALAMQNSTCRALDQSLGLWYIAKGPGTGHIAAGNSAFGSVVRQPLPPQGAAHHGT